MSSGIIYLKVGKGTQVLFPFFVPFGLYMEGANWHLIVTGELINSCSKDL